MYHYIPNLIQILLSSIFATSQWSLDSISQPEIIFFLNLLNLFTVSRCNQSLSLTIHIRRSMNLPCTSYPPGSFLPFFISSLSIQLFHVNQSETEPRQQRCYATHDDMVGVRTLLSSLCTCSQETPQTLT